MRQGGGGVFHPEGAIDSITKLTFPTFIRTELDRGSSDILVFYILHQTNIPHMVDNIRNNWSIGLNWTEQKWSATVTCQKRSLVRFSGVLVLFKCVCYTHTCLILFYFSFSDFLRESQTGNSAASVNFLLISSSLASYNRLYFISFNSMSLRHKLSVFPSSTAPLMQLTQPFPKVGSILLYWKEWFWCSHRKKEMSVAFVHSVSRSAAARYYTGFPWQLCQYLRNHVTSSILDHFSMAEELFMHCI